MSFDAIIQALRDGADSRRDMAVEAHERAVEFAARSEKHHDVARTLDLLADALATGRLTKDQLRAIVNGANAEDEPGADSGLCATHGHPLDERGMCPVVIDLAPVRTDGTYTDAQLAYNACGMCGREFGRYEDMRPFMTAAHGELMQHSNPDDCKAVDR